MARHMPAGFRSNLGAQLSLWAPRLARALRPVLIDSVARRCKLDEEELSVVRRMVGRPAEGAIDSVPVPADSPAKYNGHYRKTMFKLLVAANLRGFVIFVDGPFQGTDHDDTLWSKVPSAKKPDAVLLGDGHLSPSCAVPPNKRTIAAAETYAQQDALIVQTERVSFLRSRAEHVFGTSGPRRFRRLGRWSTHQSSLLRACAVIADF
jgi:hypothetical protein